MTTDPFLIEHRGEIALLTLNRPEAANAMNPAMIDAGLLVLDALRDNGNVRAIVVTGAGDRHFCGGFDLRSTNVVPAGAPVRNVRRRTLTHEFGRTRQATIAALNGVAMGGGCEIALACDFRVMAEEATLGLPEIKFGGLPAGGGTQRLTRLVGPAVAKRLIMLGDVVSAGDALRLGIVDEVAPREQLLERAFALARRLCDMAPYAVEVAKYLIDSAPALDLEAGLLLERQMVTNMGSPDERAAAIERAKANSATYKKIFREH
jgi:enoyl-CoA hydratase/carnithine racemase